MRRLLFALIIIVLSGCSSNLSYEENIFFGEIFADYYIEVNEPQIINLVLLANKKINFKEELSDVDINNGDLRLTNFYVSKGDRVQNQYDLINLEIEVKGISEGTFSFDELTLVFNNQEKFKKEVGNISISTNVNIKNNNQLYPPENYIVAYPSLKFETDLINNTDQEINLTDIRVNNNGLEFIDLIITNTNQEVVDTIKPSETVQLQATVIEKVPAHFYTTRPIVTYIINDQTHELYLPPVMYGYMNINDEMVNKILLD